MSFNQSSIIQEDEHCTAETPEQREVRLEAQRNRYGDCCAAETPEQRKVRVYTNTRETVGSCLIDPHTLP